MTNKTSPRGIELIKTFEGFRSKPYLCPANYWTIGYGSTRTPDGKRVTKDTPAIDSDVAEQWLVSELPLYERAVDKAVKVKLSPNQFDALVSFVYNLGPRALISSTLLARLNAGDYAGAASQFSRWVNGGGKKLAGLVARREAERLLFLS